MFAETSNKLNIHRSLIFLFGVLAIQCANHQKTRKRVDVNYEFTMFIQKFKSRELPFEITDPSIVSSYDPRFSPSMTKTQKIDTISNDNYDSITRCELKFLPKDTNSWKYKFFALYEFKTGMEFKLIMYYKKSDENQYHDEELSEQLVLVTYNKQSEIIDSIMFSGIEYNTQDRSGSIDKEFSLKLITRNYFFKERLKAKRIEQELTTTEGGRFKLIKSDTTEVNAP